MTVRRALWVVTIAAAGLCDARPAAAQGGWLARAGNAVREQFGSDRPRVFRRSIELENASLETLKSRLGWIGIDVPLELSGDVTARLGVEIDLSSPRDARSYRIDGSLSSRQLVVEGLELRDFSATARYVDGKLTLEQLVVTVPDPRPGAPAGRAAGEASMRLIPLGDLSATLRLSGVPLEPFSRRVEAAESLTGGRLTGRLNVEAPVSNVRDLRTWRGTGQVSLADLVAAGRNVSRAETGLELAEGTLTLNRLDATIEGEGVTGSGTLNLTAPFGYQVSLGVPRGDLSRLEALLGRELPETWAGGYDLTARAGGTLRPFAVDASGTLAGRNWTAAGTPVSSFRADVTSDGKAVTLSKLDVTALGGRWEGDGRIGIAAPYGYRAALNLTGLDLAEARSLPAAFDPGAPMRGVADATFKADGTLEPRVVNATGEVTIDRLAVRDVAFDSARLVGRLAPDAIELTTLEFVGPDGRLNGRGTARLAGDRKFDFRLRPERFDLATLDPALNVATREGAGEMQHVVAYRQPPDGTEQSAPGPGTATQPAPNTGRQLGGTATGDVTAQGRTLPFKLDALNGTLTFENLAFGGVTFDRAELEAVTENRTLVLSRLLLVKGEGRVTGEGRFGLDAPNAFNTTLRSEAFAIDAARPLFSQGVANMPLPPVSGRLDGTVTAAGQGQPFRLDALDANVAGDDIRIGRLLVNRFEITAATQEDRVNVSNLLVAIEDGRLTGTATLGLRGEQPFEATLRPDRFRIELLRPLFGPGGVIETDFPPVSGRVSGDVTLHGRVAPVEVQGVSGRFSAAGLVVSGVPIDRLGMMIASENGTARVSDFVAETGFGRLAGAGTVSLAAPYAYTADLTFGDFDLASIGRLTAEVTAVQRPDVRSAEEVTEGRGSFPVKLSGLADVTGKVRGTASPFVLTGDGRVASDRLQLDPRELSRLLKRTTLTEPRFAWGYNENRLTLDDISAGLGRRGTITGTAAVPLGAAAAGALDLRVASVELADLLKLPGQVGGVASGDLTARLEPADENGDRAMSGRADLSVPVLRAGRVAVGNVTTAVGLQENVIRYDVNGRAFDGALAANGTWPLKETAKDRGAGRIRWQNADLARAAAVAMTDPTIAGRLDAVVDYDLAAATKATGTIEVSDVRQKGDLVTDRLLARVFWADSVVWVENAAGGFAGGSVSFAVRLNANDPGRGTVEVLLRRVDAQRAFGWIPGLEPLTGNADLRLRGRLGDLWRWQGDGKVTQGTYGPLGFSSWRVPLEIDASPGAGAMRITARRTAIRSSGGRGTLNIVVDLGTSPRLDLDGSFNGLDAGQLLQGFGDRAPGGRVSGTVELSSRNLRGLADLNGRVTATLRGSQANNLPVIGSITDIARIPTGGGGTEDRGELRAYLRSGVARVEDLTLSGPNFRLYADGTVALASQRLGLDVVVDTSPARQDRLIAAFLLRQFVDYATPIGWIERANRFIAERAIYLRVTGTVRRPVVRVRPVEQLEQEAVRFFLNEVAAPAGPAAGAAFDLTP